MASLAVATSIPTSIRLAASIHSQSLKLGILCSDLPRTTRILTSYAQSGMVDDALHLFDEMSLHPHSLDTVSWNTIISILTHSGRDLEAFHYFKRLRLSETMTADSYTLSSLLSSPYCLETSLSVGEGLHGFAFKTGIALSISVGNALITLYSTWGRLHESRLVFRSMLRRNVVTWTALICGHARNHQEEESLRQSVEMMREHRPNQFTFASVFSACGSHAWLSQGACFITPALKTGFLADIHVQNSLVGFFAECGCVDEARGVFDAIREPDIVSWNSLLKGYSQLGRGEEALQILDEMCLEGMTPDSVTFLSVLSACSHCHMTSKGLELYRRMEQENKIEPRAEHVSCVVNLLGRAGQLTQAAEFIRRLGGKVSPSPSVWRTLLGACRTHGKSDELAEMAAKELLHLEPYDTEAHIILSNVYAAKGRWEMVGSLRRAMREKRVGKEPGSSWIEVEKKIHMFVARDWNHPQMDEIITTVIELTANSKELGLVDHQTRLMPN